jgi:hypothetical protein
MDACELALHNPCATVLSEFIVFENPEMILERQAFSGAGVSSIHRLMAKSYFLKNCF